MERTCYHATISTGGDALQGHIRRRGPAGSWEYILDVGRYRAQRCQGCGRRFWVERRSKAICPACGGELRETDERRRETKGGFVSRKECQAALTRKLTSLAEHTYEPQQMPYPLAAASKTLCRGYTGRRTRFLMRMHTPNADSRFPKETADIRTHAGDGDPLCRSFSVLCKGWPGSS